MPEAVDFIIAGQGLAGTTLAWHLHWLGARVLVVDPGHGNTSSRIAAGIVNPITGKRVALSWRVHEFLPAAVGFYRRTAAILGRDHLHLIPNVRLFRNADEIRRFGEKRPDPRFAAFVNAEPHFPLVPEPLNNPLGGIEITGGGWLDTRRWLDDSADWFRRHGMLRRARIDPASVRPCPQGITADAGGPVTAGTLVFCEGSDAAANPWFPWLRWKSAKGEILSLRIPGLTLDRIVHCGLWLLPCEGGGFRAGSTYAWDDLTATPTAHGRATIETGLRSLLRLPWEVTDHEAAVRPIIRESRALIGRHPAHPQIAFFNGLGSKGVMHAPHFAGSLAANLVSGRPIDPRCDVAGNH